MHSFWEWSDSKLAVVPASMIFNTQAQAPWRSLPTPLRWWLGKQRLHQLSASRRIQSLLLPQSSPFREWTGGQNGARLWLYFHLWNVSRTWTTWSQPWVRTSRGWYPVLVQVTEAWDGWKKHWYAKEWTRTWSHLSLGTPSGSSSQTALINWESLGPKGNT